MGLRTLQLIDAHYKENHRNWSLIQHDVERRWIFERRLRMKLVHTTQFTSFTCLMEEIKTHFVGLL